MLDDDVQIDEKDVEIPAELDPSQNSKFPNFEPKWIKEMVIFCVTVVFLKLFFYQRFIYMHD